MLRNCNFTSFIGQTETLPMSEAIALAAKHANDNALQGVTFRHLNPVPSNSSPKTVQCSLVNLKVYKGIRSNDPKVKRCTGIGEVVVLNSPHSA